MLVKAARCSLVYQAERHVGDRSAFSQRRRGVHQAGLLAPVAKCHAGLLAKQAMKSPGAFIQPDGPLFRVL